MRYSPACSIACPYDWADKTRTIAARRQSEIVGAYRIAECRAVIERQGLDALYTHTLFRYTPAFDAYLDDRPGWIILSTISPDGYPHSVPLGYFRLGDDIQCNAFATPD